MYDFLYTSLNAHFSKYNIIKLSAILSSYKVTLRNAMHRCRLYIATAYVRIYEQLHKQKPNLSSSRKYQDAERVPRFQALFESLVFYNTKIKSPRQNSVSPPRSRCFSRRGSGFANPAKKCASDNFASYL